MRHVDPVGVFTNQIDQPLVLTSFLERLVGVKRLAADVIMKGTRPEQAQLTKNNQLHKTRETIAKIDAMVERTRVRGLVIGTGNELSAICTMHYIDFMVVTLVTSVLAALAVNRFLLGNRAEFIGFRSITA